MNPGLEEIRINERFASRLKSTYSGERDENSIPNVRIDNVRTEEYLIKLLGELDPQSSQSLIPPNCRFFKTYKNGNYINLGTWLDEPSFGLFCDGEFKVIDWK